LKKLDQYVIKEMFVPFLIGTFAVVFMFQANTLIYLFKTFSLASIPPLAIAKLIALKTPFYLNMTLPVGVALASSLGMSRLTRESELTAMRAAGVSILRVMAPISAFGVLIGIGNYYLAESVMPPAEKSATKLQTQLTILGGAPEFKADVLIHLGTFWAHFGSVSRGPNGSLDIADAFLIESPGPYEQTVYTSKQGTYAQGVWSFPNSIYRVFKDDQLTEFLPRKGLTINQQVDLNDLYTPQQATELSVGQLREAIKTKKQQGQDTTSLEVSLQTRFSVPAACYVFALVGPVFAIWLGRSGGFVGVLLSILMVLLYYNIYVISTEVFGRNGWLSPVLSAWLPNILFLALAFIGLRRLE